MLAAALQRRLGPGTANIGQDHFRRVVLREHDVCGGDNIELIATTVTYCLGIGYHVILEGILGTEHYGVMLRRLVDDHSAPSHVFYLDVTLEETLRRHEERDLRATVRSETMRGWYVESDVLGIPGEVVIEGDLDLDETLDVVRDHIGPVAASIERDPSRFL